uniref:Secreted protein n=1 Tax=Haemonchus contortus TaxID=6289 RepID=A0A7I4Z5G7_HAECO
MYLPFLLLLTASASAVLNVRSGARNAEILPLPNQQTTPKVSPPVPPAVTPDPNGMKFCIVCYMAPYGPSQAAASRNGWVPPYGGAAPWPMPMQGGFYGRRPGSRW